MDKPGYHLKHINKGVFGELSKAFEEVKELKDARRNAILLWDRGCRAKNVLRNFKGFK